MEIYCRIDLYWALRGYVMRNVEMPPIWWGDIARFEYEMECIFGVDDHGY
jgi:hypothetical protein